MVPEISIVTACYNSEKFIQATIQSVLEQTFENWEWIIVDDCSRDNSVELIHQHQDQRITLIALNENVGAAQARNIAVEKARGRFLTFLDSDDVWLPKFLETAVNYLKNNQEELVYASYKRFNEDLKPLLEDFIAEDKVTYKRLLFNCPIPMLTAMYDTQRIGKIPIPEVDMREDYAMWLNVL